MKPKETLDSDCTKLSIPESAENAHVVFAVSPAQPLWETVLERGIFKSKGGTSHSQILARWNCCYLPQLMIINGAIS